MYDVDEGPICPAIEFSWYFQFQAVAALTNCSCKRLKEMDVPLL